MKYLRVIIDIVVWFCIGVLLVGIPTLLFHTKPKEKVVPVRISPIVRLVKDGKTFCSGVVIRRDLVLTALHCVSSPVMFSAPVLDADAIEIRGVDNKPLNAFGHVVNAREQLDQAIIQGNFESFQPMKVTMTVSDLLTYQKKGEHFMACGYPLGGGLFCQNVFFDSNKEFMWAMHGVILPGMSGGPVVAQDGSVVATNDAVEGELSIVAPVWNIDGMYPEAKK